MFISTGSTRVLYIIKFYNEVFLGLGALSSVKGKGHQEPSFHRYVPRKRHDEPFAGPKS